MVDRIVPASTDGDPGRARSALGAGDLAAVDAEPYRQWVIEDDFPGGRPAWERPGPCSPPTSTQWERLKLRVLNGVHSTLAYLGALAGCRTIAEALALPGLTAPCCGGWSREDIAPTLDPPAGVRWPTTASRSWSASPTPPSSTAPCRWPWTARRSCRSGCCGTILDRRPPARVPGYAALALAAWMRFVQGTADDGAALPLDDPLAETIRAALPLRRTRPAPWPLLGLDGVFPAELADDTDWHRIAYWLDRLAAAGVAATIRHAAAPVAAPLARAVGGERPGGADRRDRSRRAGTGGPSPNCGGRPGPNWSAWRRPRGARRPAGRAAVHRPPDLLAAAQPDVVIICTPPHTHLGDRRGRRAGRRGRAAGEAAGARPGRARRTARRCWPRTGRACQVGFQALGSAALAGLVDAIAGRRPRHRDRHRGAGRVVARRGLLPPRRPGSAGAASAADRRWTARWPTRSPTRSCRCWPWPSSPVETVEVERYRTRDIEVDDTASLRLGFAGGLRALIAVTLCAETFVAGEITVTGTAGTAVLEYPTDRLRLPGEADLSTVPGRVGLLANLLDHRADPAVPLIAPLARGPGRSPRCWPRSWTRYRCRSAGLSGDPP